MKRLILFLFLCSISTGLYAQVWTDAASLPLYGKGVEETYTIYSRLPSSLETVCRPPVWRLGQNSAGLYLRFQTDSPTLWVKWETLRSHVMDHMCPTGSCGLDLYVLVDGQWRFLTAARPKLGNKETTRKIMQDMKPQMREYMLYLSLYDGVVDLFIGTDEGHPVLPSEVTSPRDDRPIVMYGSSITQGGCVSRPGMCYTSILSRRLDREFVNLGFSGNGYLDLEIASMMASVPDPALYIIACTENAKPDHFAQRGEDFFRILRDAHPDVPVIFVQKVRYSHSLLNVKQAERMVLKMEACRALYDKLRKSGEKNLYFYDPGEDPSFDDMESSVDGIHLTDLGATRFADGIQPVIRKALRRAGIR